MRRHVRLLAGVAAGLALAGCEVRKSSNPLSPAIAGPIAGVTISEPRVMSPTGGAQIAVDQQPISLTVQNAQTSGVRPLTYDFQIASDAGFTTILFNQTGVAPGDSGQTTLRLPQPLAADHTYYWRSRAEDGANIGDFTTASFAVYTPVVLQPPAPSSPADGATVSSTRPTLTVTNSARSGPAGAISYWFEVASDANMVNRVVTGFSNETANQTAFIVTSDLTAGTRYYWHAKATDPSHASAFSSTIAFVTPTAPAPAPTPSPSPSPAPVPGQTDTLTNAIIQNSPLDLGRWPVTSALTQVDMRPGGIHVEFSKRDGPGRWPDIVPPGWGGPLQYTLGMCLNIGGQWYCSAVIEFWYGLDESGGPLTEIAKNWFYDPIRWGPMAGHQPATGETIGIFVCAGDCRNNLAGDLSPAKERTNVVLVPMPSPSGATYNFPSGVSTLAIKKR